MRLYISLLLAVLSTSIPLVAGAQTTEAISRAEAQAQAKRLNFAPSPKTSTYDMVYQRAEWTVNPAVRYIKGAVSSHFKTIEPNVSQIWMDLDDALRVDSVYYHTQKVPFQQTSEKLLRINLPATLALNTLDSVTVFYQGIPPVTGHGSFEKNTHNGVPIIWTLSEPYGARDWWPCKQSLTDKIDSIDILVRTPADYRAASNGVLISEKAAGTDKIYHWRHRYPIVTYLVAIAVTNYVAFSDFVTHEGKSIEVLNYVYPENEAAIKPQVKKIVGIMQLFNELFGLYPFADEKYGHAQFGWGGGMEHQTMSFMGGFGYDLMAHELAHQWFGNKVTCGSWQDIWVNEGFATYLTGLTKEHLGTPAEWRGWKLSKISSITSYKDGSVWVKDTLNVDRVFSSILTYNKGAYLLHMLRWVVGDEDFYQGINNYLKDPKLAYGFARAEDVKRHLEAASGKNLTEFFKDWYYGEGYPIYSLMYENQGTNKIKVKLSQASSAPASVDFFEMPVPILFRDKTGTQEVTKVFQHQSQDQEFSIELPFEVAEVIFDPELWLLTPQATITSLEESLAANLKLYPNPTNTKITLEATPGLSLKEIRLLDLQGKQIMAVNAKGKSTFELNLQDLPAATYLLRIQTSQGWTTKRFTKQ